jgi:phosphoribosyl-AMP cyclohydrolase
MLRAMIVILTLSENIHKSESCRASQDNEFQAKCSILNAMAFLTAPGSAMLVSSRYSAPLLCKREASDPLLRHGPRRIARTRDAVQCHLPIHSSATDDRAAPLPPGTWDGLEIDPSELIAAVKFDAAGLVPAVAQQYDSGEILMVAWMNAESIAETLSGGRAVYYSRSRKMLWRKGDTSGQVQALCDVLLDCDGDTIVLKVDQKGVACHTGRRSCFYKAFRPATGACVEIQDILVDPKQLYSEAPTSPSM